MFDAAVPHALWWVLYFRDLDVFLLRGIANGAWWDLFCGSLNRLILDINSHRVDTQYSLSEKFEVHR
jgi:hypothetical protein